MPNDNNVLVHFWEQVIHQLAPSLIDAQSVIGQLSSLFVVKHFSRNTFMLSESDTWQPFWLMGSGICRMYYSDLEGNEHNKNFFSQGQCLWPVLERYQTQACGFNIQVIENAEVLSADIKQVKNCLEKYDLWSRFYQKTTSIILEDKLLREHHWLKLTAKERYQQLVDNKPLWAERVPDYHLASYLGISPVSLSRLKAE